jgi:hypothetical protein
MLFVIKKLKLMLICILICINTACANNINVQLHVVDDEKQPVENAQVNMGFLLSKGSNSFKGFTDKNGYIEASEHGLWGVGFAIRKAGYYTSTKRAGKNEDQNLTLILRKIKNPIAMYAKKVRLGFPKKKETYGFDFEKGDWVAPYGKGLKAQMFVYFDGNWDSIWNFQAELKISFPNKGDGLLVQKKPVYESEYKFPFMAPKGNYLNYLTHKKNSTKNEAITTINQSLLGYTFQINTVLDDDGNVTSANYGKIIKDIFFTSNNNEKDLEGGMKFTYYYNPIVNDRNIEFDLKRNLFTGLKGQDIITQP